MSEETNKSIIIRDIRSITEMRAVEELQREVWGVPDLDIVPVGQLIAAVTAGGILLGAFDGETLVGFVYGFVGYEYEQISHHSHMLAIKSGYRNYDLGRRLKFVQRERVLEQGIKLMTWTFDPLQSLNAYFNFNKLGGCSDRYFINFYGEEAASFLHQTGTDRFLVKWDLTKDPGQEIKDESNIKQEFGGITPLIKVGIDEYPILNDMEEGLNANQIMIEIPSNINELVERNSELAVNWRKHTRLVFTKAINKGFVVEKFYRVKNGDQKFGVYVLNRK